MPIEWYDISFDVPNFKSRFPNYDDSTDLAPPMTGVNATRFRASGFRDFSGPVALGEIKDVHSIGSIGGTIARPPKISSLSLGDVKKLLGKKITTPAQAHHDEHRRGGAADLINPARAPGGPTS